MATKQRRGTRGLSLLLPLLLLLCPLANALDPHRSLDHYGHQLWRTDSGLPQNTVHSVLQTRDGYLWLGTDGGLVRFDGIDFVTFDVENTPQLKSDTINDLLEDAAGSLWISTAAGLLRYQNGAFASYSSEQGLPADAVWFSYQDHQQRIWAMTAEGPACLTGKAFAPVAGTQAAVPLNRQALAEDDQGRLWVGSSGGLFLLDTRTGAPHLAAHLLNGAAVEAVLLDGQTVWVGSNEGLARWRNGSLVPVPLPSLPAKTGVTALFADASGLFAGTAAGVVHLGGDGSLSALPGKGLPVRHVDRFYRDRQGSLWLASEQGAFRLEGDQLAAFPPGSELAGDRVLAIYEDREGIWWGPKPAA